MCDEVFYILSLLRTLIDKNIYEKNLYIYIYYTYIMTYPCCKISNKMWPKGFQFCVLCASYRLVFNFCSGDKLSPFNKGGILSPQHFDMLTHDKNK